MAKKKLSPPTWDEQNQRWKKVAYCNNMSKTFYSKRRGVTSAEKEIRGVSNSHKPLEKPVLTGTLSILTNLKK